MCAGPAGDSRISRQRLGEPLTMVIAEPPCPPGRGSVWNPPTAKPGMREGALYTIPETSASATPSAYQAAAVAPLVDQFPRNKSNHESGVKTRSRIGFRSIKPISAATTKSRDIFFLPSKKGPLLTTARRLAYRLTDRRFVPGNLGGTGRLLQTFGKAQLPVCLSSQPPKLATRIIRYIAAPPRPSLPGIIAYWRGGSLASSQPRCQPLLRPKI